MAPNGILLVDKPQGLTSHDVVARVRRALGTKKVGHAGTLDPMATGLLVLGVGPSTRLLTHLVGLDKEYTATIRLGERTVTDDAEGEAIEATPVPDDAGLAAGMAALTGAILQRPSAVSAIKVDGVRAYQRVRDGDDVELQPRPVTVRAFELLARRERDADVRVECSSGTYVRALARDLGGHLTALRRTRVGPFSVADASPLPAAPEPRIPARFVQNGTESQTGMHETHRDAAEWSGRAALLEPAEVAEQLFPVLRLDAQQTVDLGHGKALAVEHPDAPVVAAIAPDGRLVGLVEIADGTTRVLTNFPTEAVDA